VAQLLILLTFVVIIGVVVFLRVRSSGGRERVAARAAPLVRVFLERTGYQLIGAAGMQLEAQAERWQHMYLASHSGQPYDVHLVRLYHGLEVHWQHLKTAAYRNFTWSQTWWCPLASPPRTQFHVAERSNLNPRMQSSWRPAFPRMMATGDAELDRRFLVYTAHDEHAVRAILANPTLRGALLGCAHVDLRVLADSVSFSDPMQTNAVHMLGGPMASIPIMVDPGRTFEMTLPLHEHIASILHGAASMSR